MTAKVILAIIALCLACFSIGFSLSSLLWTLPVKVSTRNREKDKSTKHSIEKHTKSSKRTDK